MTIVSAVSLARPCEACLERLSHSEIENKIRAWRIPRKLSFMRRNLVFGTHELPLMSRLLHRNKANKIIYGISSKHISGYLRDMKLLRKLLGVLKMSY